MARITLLADTAPETMHAMLSDFKFDMSADNLGGQGRIINCKDRDVDAIKALIGDRKIKEIQFGNVE